MFATSDGAPLSPLDEIAQERQRIAARLARLDEERATLTEQLAELDAAERVLTRLSRLQPPLAPSLGRRPARGRNREKAQSPSLGDATLHAVEALGSDVSADEVRSYLEHEFGMRVRPNHLGMALQRHRRAGRLEQHDTRWSMSDGKTGRP